MAEEEKPQEEPPKKRSKLPLLLGLVLALAGAGGGYFAVTSGLLPGGESPHAADPGAHGEKGDEAGPVEVAALPEVEFLPIEPLIVSLNTSNGTHLRFRAQLEVRRAYRSEVEHLLPRVVDVLNGYLRAISLADLQDNAALVRLRAQMLRRVQVVTGGDRVSDLLIMEFVLN